MITAICIIGIFLTKQVSRLKLVILQTTTSGSAKLYTVAKIGVKIHAPWLENIFIYSMVYLGMAIAT